MYRVYRVHRDNEGKIFHRVPIGCARTEKGARALVAGQWGECVIEKYHNTNKADPTARRGEKEVWIW